MVDLFQIRMKNKIRIVVSSPENVNNEVNKVRESVSGIVLVNSHPQLQKQFLIQGRSAELLLQEYPELAADHQVRLIYFQVRLIQFWPSSVYFRSSPGFSTLALRHHKRLAREEKRYQGLARLLSLN